MDGNKTTDSEGAHINFLKLGKTQFYCFNSQKLKKYSGYRSFETANDR